MIPNINGHIFAAEQIHSVADLYECQWTCLFCRMVIKPIMTHIKDKRLPSGYPLASCAEYKKQQSDKK